MSCALLYTIEKFQEKNSTKVAYSIPAMCLGFFCKFNQTKIKDEDLGNLVVNYAFVSNLVLKASLQKHFIYKACCTLSLTCFLEIYNNKFSKLCKKS